MSRVQLALNVDDLDDRNHVLLQAVQHRAGQGQARLRQLRDRRAAVEAGAAGEPRPGRHPQPPRGGGRLQRRRACRDRPAWPRTACSPRRRSAPPAASPPRTRCGSPDPAGERWEVYTVLADSETFGDSPNHPADARATVRAAARRRRRQRDAARRAAADRDHCTPQHDRRRRLKHSVPARLSALDRLLPVWIVAAMAARAAAGPTGPRPGHRPERRSKSTGSRCRSQLGLADHDVSGAGQGPLRPPRHRHRRPHAAGQLAAAQLGARPGADVRPGLAAAARICPNTAPG